MRKNLVQLAVSILFMFVTSNTVNAQWVKTSGPTGGGYISALAVSGAGDIFAEPIVAVFIFPLITEQVGLPLIQASRILMCIHLP